MRSIKSFGKNRTMTSEVYEELMELLKEENENMTNDIKEIERKITLEKEQLEADRRGLLHIEGEIASVADAEQAIQAWRVSMARLNRPSVLVPKHMLENQRSLQAHTATRAALLESIATRQAKIRSLDAQREQALSANHKAAWSIVCNRAAEVAQEVDSAAAAYREASTRLMALYCCRKDFSENFPEPVQRVLAPIPLDTLKRPYDLGMASPDERRLTDQARSWRSRLASDATAASPF